MDPEPQTSIKIDYSAHHWRWTAPLRGVCSFLLSIGALHAFHRRKFAAFERRSLKCHFMFPNDGVLDILSIHIWSSRSLTPEAIDSVENILRVIEAVTPKAKGLGTVWAQVHMTREQYDVAEKEIRTVLQESPDDLLSLGLLGDCLYEKGRFRDAQMVYRDVLGRCPSYGEVRRNLVYISAVRDEWPEVLALTEQCKDVHGSGAYLLDFRVDALVKLVCSCRSEVGMQRNRRRGFLFGSFSFVNCGGYVDNPFVVKGSAFFRTAVWEDRTGGGGDLKHGTYAKPLPQMDPASCSFRPP